METQIFDLWKDSVKILPNSMAVLVRSADLANFAKENRKTMVFCGIVGN